MPLKILSEQIQNLGFEKIEQQLQRILANPKFNAAKQDTIHIDIPKGTYVPMFCDQTEIKSNTTSRISKSPVVSFEGSWPTVIVRPFQNLTGDGSLNACRR